MKICPECTRWYNNEQTVCPVCYVKLLSNEVSSEDGDDGIFDPAPVPDGKD